MSLQPVFLRTMFVACALALAACSSDRADELAEAEETPEAPRGSYDIDRETGETRATFTDDDGTITTMLSGDKVPVRLPAGFTLYPDAKVTGNTRVEQADGTLVLLNLESGDEAGKLIDFYREQAEAAGIAVDVELTGDRMSMIGGKAKDGTSFSFTATRGSETTAGQLSVGRGFK